MKRIIFLLVVLLLSVTASAQVGRFKNIPVIYRGYSLKFDTANGALFAVHIDDESGVVTEEVISNQKSNTPSEVGRYEFSHTKTIGSYQIFDTSTGTYTKVQWKPKDGEEEMPDTIEPAPPLPDVRAAFPGISKKDNNSISHYNEEDGASEGFKAGNVEGSCNAHLQGRSVVGSLPKPSYGVQAEGTVVVQIKVDQYGNVVEAIPGAEGTTVTNKELWKTARNAAMRAHFSMKADSPALQTGTITYIFKIN